jgi:hypothetical protein
MRNLQFSNALEELRSTIFTRVETDHSCSLVVLAGPEIYLETSSSPAKLDLHLATGSLFVRFRTVVQWFLTRGLGLVFEADFNKVSFLRALLVL